MDEQHFARLLESRRRRHGLQPLFATQSPAQLIRRASRACRRYEALADAWRQVCEPALARECEVAGVREDTAIIIAANSSVLFELRQQAPLLTRHVARLAPGVRRLRFVLMRGLRDNIEEE
jgi:hypothetical protein